MNKKEAEQNVERSERKKSWKMIETILKKDSSLEISVYKLR